MKILIVTGIFRPEFGGPATLAEDLALRLKSLGYSVTVLTYSDQTSFDFDKEYPFKLIRVKRSHKLANYIKFFFKLMTLMPKHDVVYTLDWFSAGMPVLAASLFRHKKYIVRVGGGYIWEKYLMEGKPPVTLKDFYRKGFYKQYPLMYRIIRMVLRNGTYVVFNSEEQKNLYEEFYALNPTKTKVIHNIMPQHKFGTLLKTFKQDRKLVEQDKEIVFWGRFIKMKNIESLIAAFAKLKDYSYKLLLIGQGPLEPQLRAYVETLGLSHRVTFMEPMNHKDLFRRIANCAYVVIPSWTDISPHQVYECLAQGIPFLLTQENYLPINDYPFLKINPASVDDIAEKMNRLLDPEKYNEFVADLQKIEVPYTTDDIVAEHMKLFQKVIKS